MDKNCAPTTPTEKGEKRKNAKNRHQKFGKAYWSPPKDQTRPRRYRPGTRALREIQKYEKTTELLIPKNALSKGSERDPTERTCLTSHSGKHCSWLSTRQRRFTLFASWKIPTYV